MFCENCGAEIKEGNQFCTNCGTKTTAISFGEFNKKIDQGIFSNNEGSVDVGLTQVNNMNNTGQYNTGTNQFNTGTNSFTNSGQWGVVEEPKKKKKGLVIFLVLLLLLLLAGGAFAGYWFFLRQKPINPEEFISVKVDKALDGYAKAEVNINYNKLSNLIGYKNLKKALVEGMSEKELKELQKEKNFKIDNATETKAGKEALNASNIISVTYDKTEYLSNGDEIVFTFEPAEGLKYSDVEELFKTMKIKMDGKYSYEVSGLESGRKVEIMPSNVENYISYVGTDGNGSAVVNFNNLKYKFDNDYEVVLNGNIGTVSYKNSIVGRLGFEFLTKEGDPKQGKLSKGDKILLAALPDESLTQHFIDQKISAQNVANLVVGDLGSFADPSSLTSQQLVALSEKLVIDFRNNYAEGCPDVGAMYSMKNKKSPEDYYLGYLFKSTDKQYYFYYNQVYKSPDGSNVVFGEAANTIYLGNSDKDLKTKLSDFDLTSIDHSAVSRNKYAVGKELITTAKGINVRTGPGVNYDKYKINGKYQAYEEGEVLVVYDEARDSDNDLWYKVGFYRNGREHQQWITGKYVEIVEASGGRGSANG